MTLRPAGDKEVPNASHQLEPLGYGVLPGVLAPEEIAALSAEITSVPETFPPDQHLLAKPACCRFGSGIVDCRHGWVIRVVSMMGKYRTELIANSIVMQYFEGKYKGLFEIR